MIWDSVQDLGRRLLNCEPTDAQLAERYRQEVSAMLYRNSGVRRPFQIVCGSVLILMAIALAIGMEYAGEGSIPFFWRWITTMGASSMGIVGAALLVCAILRIDLRRYRTIWFGLLLLFMVILAGGILLEAWQVENAQLQRQLTEAAFVLLGLLGVSTVVYLIEGFQKRMELQLLNLEYRLADLTAKLDRS